MRSTSSRGKRRWPPRVTMQAMRPSCAHRFTVLGDTCNMRATSPGVRYSDFGCDSDTDGTPGFVLSNILLRPGRLSTSILPTRPSCLVSESGVSSVLRHEVGTGDPGGGRH